MTREQLQHALKQIRQQQDRIGRQAVVALLIGVTAAGIAVAVVLAMLVGDEKPVEPVNPAPPVDVAKMEKALGEHAQALSRVKQQVDDLSRKFAQTPQDDSPSGGVTAEQLKKTDSNLRQTMLDLNNRVRDDILKIRIERQMFIARSEPLNTFTIARMLEQELPIDLSGSSYVSRTARSGETLYFQVTGIDQASGGMAINLLIGNPNNVHITGMEMTFKHGQPNDTRDPDKYFAWREQLKSVTLQVSQMLPAGTWTPVRVVIPGAVKGQTTYLGVTPVVTNVQLLR